MIPFFDYRPHLARHRPEIDAAIARVLDSGSLVLGEEGKAFEDEFARFVGARFAVGVASGTDAITLGLRALGIGEGDEVLTVANAGVAPVVGIRAAGAIPRFVDVDADSLLLDPLLVEAAIGPQTRALLPVHLHGNPVDTRALRQIADAHDLFLVEDCAQAHGAKMGGASVGLLGDVGCFSFYPTKNLGAYGDGGLCVSGDPEVASRLREQRMYGFRGDAFAHVEGRNSRLDEIQAAILRVKLRHLEADVAERRALAAVYQRELAEAPVQVALTHKEGRHAFHLFVVQVPERKRILEHLAAAGVGHGLHYPVPIPKMDAYASFDRPGELPTTEAACERVLSLPLYPGLSEDAVVKASRALVAALAGLRSPRV